MRNFAINFRSIAEESRNCKWWRPYPNIADTCGWRLHQHASTTGLSM